MPKKLSGNTLDGAVPKTAQTKRLREGEKKSLELGELAEHTHGKERERLQKAARKAAG